MRARVSAAGVPAVNGQDPVDTTHLDHIPTEEELDQLASVPRATDGDLTDLETERMLEERHWDLGPDDEER